jgi:hypothetical protein
MNPLYLLYNRQKGMTLMNHLDITLRLPEDIVTRAQSAGLLTEARIIEFLEKELERQQRVDRLFENIDKLHTMEPLLSQEDIDEAIQASRATQA